MKNIVITGASSGIGLATATKLAQRGYRLMLIARRPFKLTSLNESAEGLVEYATLDVVDYHSVKALAETLSQSWGRVDVLINNAGVGVFDRVDEGKIEDWHAMINTNVTGLLNGVHAFLPQLIQSKGHIINLGSLASHQVMPNSGIYCATKHAVHAISESLHLELAGKIKVTMISPGVVNTAFIDQTKSDEMLHMYKDYFAEGMSPEIVADQIVHAIELEGNGVISEIIIRPNRSIR
jgi:NADP-dependent 3-hydroxy acid dehydrogenase YdfG